MIKIKEEFKNRIYPLSAEEYAQLEENILKEGIREPILTWDNYIVDGHNRYEIAQKHNLKYLTAEVQFADDNECEQWMIKNQFGRRNLSNYQRSVLALALEDLYAKKAKQNLKLSEGKGKQKSADLKVQPIETRKEVAKVANVSHDTIAKVKVIEAKAAPEVKQKLSTGEVSINQVYQEIKKEEKKVEKETERKKLAEEGAKKDIDIDFRLGDFEEVFADLPDGSVDCIITDPPYPLEFIECWSKLSRFAKRVLKPNGFCIAYSGQMNLPEVMKRMNEHLDYYWTFSLLHTGSRQLINGRSLFCGWKPILVFQNGFKKIDTPFDDFITGSGMEKSHHRWQQAVDELDHLVLNFTKQNDLILEPFAGGGTTILSALKHKRNIKAAEIDETSFNVTKKRLHDAKTGQLL